MRTGLVLTLIAFALVMVLGATVLALARIHVMARSSLSVVFAGSGGSGAMTAGTIFLRSAARAGYYGLMT